MRLCVYLNGTHKARTVFEVANVTRPRRLRSNEKGVRKAHRRFSGIHSFSVSGLHGIVSVLNAWARRDAETPRRRDGSARVQASASVREEISRRGSVDRDARDTE